MTYPAPPPPPMPDYFRASDHENALMVFRVKAYEPQYSGWSEPQPAVRCDVEAIDPPAGPWRDAWVGNELVVGQLKGSVGKTFYARLVKRGRAFVLDPINYGDEQKIDAWAQSKSHVDSAPAAPQPSTSDRPGVPFSTPSPEPPPRSPARPAVTDDVPF
jgi:hypothetical protein